MRILLDECLPSDLVKELKGHEVRTVTQAGWSGIGNGELLRIASRDYEVLLTIDQRLSREQRIPATLAGYYSRSVDEPHRFTSTANPGS